MEYMEHGKLVQFPNPFAPDGTLQYSGGLFLSFMHRSLVTPDPIGEWV